MRNCMRLSFALAAVAVTGFITLPGAIAQQAASGAPPPSVTVVRAVEKDIRPSASFSGRVEAIDKVDLRARVDGFLEQKLFKDGQDVKAGDLLFVMEKGQYAKPPSPRPRAISRHRRHCCHWPISRSSGRPTWWPRALRRNRSWIWQSPSNSRPAASSTS
jgi:hypothetical protein